MKKLKTSPVLQIILGAVVAVIAAVVYVILLNRAVTTNTLATIDELAQHDKRSVESFIETCWNDLEGISQRFVNYNCQSLLDIETRMNLEAATSNFSHIYLLADDGKVYTDKYVVYDPKKDSMSRSVNLLPYFDNDKDRIVERWDDKSASAGMSREYVLYGVRLDGFEVDGIRMLAIIGLSDTVHIQKHVILDSFVKEDGVRRGYSAVISASGDYIIGTHKTLYLNEKDNLYSVLATGTQPELTNTEIDTKIRSGETFRFHYTDADGVEKLLCFTPFGVDIDWYFMMVVENAAFTEQSRQFVYLSAAMLTVILLAVILLMLALNASRSRQIHAEAKAKAQSEFLSNMSHEIRTPLNGFIGLNHLIMTHIDEEGQTAQIKDWLRKSYSTANYLLSLVNDILDMSKLQAGRADIIQEPVELELLIDTVWSMQRDNVESRGIRFVLERDISAAPCIIGDDTRLKQVLMNIIGNAAKFTCKGGSITLTVRQEPMEDGRVRTVFQCRDTGVGMSGDFLKTIFDAFSQERNKNSNSVKGTGLGMSISKLLMDAMGGEISVESELNVGTVFTVSLPAEIAALPAGEPCPQEAAVPDEVQPAGDGPVKVLVAEDNELNAEILLDILTEEGFEVILAENGRIAVDEFSKSRNGEFNIILMDMQMPVLDGCSASREIRSLNRPDAKTVQIFACTANTFKEDRDKAMDSGMNDFLAKPIDVELLLKKLGTARNA